MSKVVLTLAATTVGLGLVCLHLVKQLRDGDATIAELKSQVSALQAEVTAVRNLPRPVPGTIPGVTVVHSSAGVGAPPPQSQAASAQAARQTDSPRLAARAVTMPAAAGPESREDQLRMIREHRERQRQLMQDPDYREALRLQARTSYARQYPGLIQELGLDPQQAEEFFALLADQQIRSSERMEPLWDELEPVDPTAMQQRHQEIQRAAAEMQRTNEEEIAARFGADKLQAWKDYQSTLGQRWQLEQMRSALAAQGLPLSEDVSKPMLKALAEVDRLEMQEIAASSGAGPWTARVVGSMAPLDGRNVEQQLEAARKRNQRKLDAISSYLTPQQRQVIEREHEAQEKMLEAQLRLIRDQGPNPPGLYFFGGQSAVATMSSPKQQ